MDAQPLRSQLQHWLSSASHGADARLPPERDLAVRFGVTRAALRKVLAALEAEGQIRRHVGRGTFIGTPATRVPISGQDIAERTSPLAAMQARRVVEPELARLAALGATTTQLSGMRALCHDMRRAMTWDSYAELDWRFHNLIAEATGNPLLVEIQGLLNGVRRHVVWGGLIRRTERPPADYHSFAEHAAIVDAIQSRSSGQAMRCMLTHLDSTLAQLTDDGRRQAVHAS